MASKLIQSFDGQGPTQDWASELRCLAGRCSNAAAPEDGSLIRDVHCLLFKAPVAVVALIGNLPARSLIDSLLLLEAYESATLKMLPDQIGYLLSRGPGRSYWLASTCLEGRDEDVTCRASSASAALLGAFLSELSEIMEAQLTTWPARSALN